MQVHSRDPNCKYAIFIRYPAIARPGVAQPWLEHEIWLPQLQPSRPGPRSCCCSRTCQPNTPRRWPGAVGAAVLSAGALDASAYGPAEAVSRKPPPKAPKAEEPKKVDDFVKLESGLAYQNKKVNTGALANVEMKVRTSPR